MTGRHAETGSPDVRQVSVGQLLGEISEDLSVLFRQEIELAKAEIKEEATKAGKGAGMLGGAALAGYLTVLFLSFAAWWGMANVMDVGVAALIVGLIWAVIAAFLAVTGRATIRRVNPKPERTINTTREIPSALKGQ
jgi:hypothetical protein